MSITVKALLVVATVIIGIIIGQIAEACTNLFGSTACAAFFLVMLIVGVVLCAVVYYETSTSRRYRGIRK